MSTTLRFREHDEFHRAALRMAGAGAIAGFLTAAVLRGAAPTWALAAVAAAAVVAAVGPALWARPGELAVRLGLGGFGAAALVLIPRLGEPTSAVVVFAALTGGALAWGLEGRRRVVAILVAAAAVLLARHVFLSISGARIFASWPDWLVTAGSGAGFALVAVFALVPRHLAVARDPVSDSYRQIAGLLTGEARDLVDRGYRLWTEAAGDLDAGDASRSILEDSVTRLVDVARRWQAVEGAASQTMASALVERMETLQQRIDATDDDIIRTQYEQARAALAEQLRYVKEIHTNRERVLARMHNYLAAMERLHLAVLNLASTHASCDADDIQPLVDNLEQIGADMDTCSRALIEAEALTAA